MSRDPCGYWEDFSAEGILCKSTEARACVQGHVAGEEQGALARVRPGVCVQVCAHDPLVLWGKEASPGLEQSSALA